MESSRPLTSWLKNIKLKSIFIHFKKKSKLVNIIIHAWTSAIPHEKTTRYGFHALTPQLMN